MNGTFMSQLSKAYNRCQLRIENSIKNYMGKLLSMYDINVLIICFFSMDYLNKQKNVFLFITTFV